MPTGGYRHAATAFAASSAVLMSGTMMPYAPRSSAFMMVAGSFHGTRTTGTVSVCEIAWSIGQTSLMSVVPCCMSTQRASKPCRAMTSAVNPWETESQPSVTNRPSRHICLILFGRTVAPRVVEWPVTRRARSVAHARGPGSGALSTRRLDNLNEGTQSSPVPRRGRAVQLPALQGLASQAPEGARARGRGRQSSSRAVPSRRAVAGFLDGLRHARDGRRLDRAQALRGESRRCRIPESAGGPRPVSVRIVQARRGAGPGGQRDVLAASPERQAARDESRARRGDAPGDAQAARGRRRLRLARPDGAGGPA